MPTFLQKPNRSNIGSTVRATRRPLSLLDEIRTRNQDGVVILNLQPVDQLNSIKAVMVGRVGLDAQDERKPIYTLSVEGDRLLCAGTPPGMAIRTESGRRGQIVLNGVQIDLQSVAYITLTPDGRMTIVNLEGHVDVTVVGDRRTLAVGEQVQVAPSSGSPRLCRRACCLSISGFARAPVAGQRGLAQCAQHQRNPSGMQRQNCLWHRYHPSKRRTGRRRMSFPLLCSGRGQSQRCHERSRTITRSLA